MAYDQNSRSWFSSKNNTVPAHPGVAPAPTLYNIGPGGASTQQLPPSVWNNGLQQGYWQSNPSTTAPSPRPPSQGNIHSDSSWNWGPQPNYQQHQVHPHYNQPTPVSYHSHMDQQYYGNSNIQTAPTANSDPWNWGTEDSSSSEGMNNNVDSADPTWNWSVDGSTSYQQPNQQPYQVQQPSNQYAIPPSHEKSPVLGSGSSDVRHTFPTNYSQHEASPYFQGHPETNYSSTSVSDHPEENGMGHYENLNTVHESSSQLQSTATNNYFVTDSNNQVQDNISLTTENVYSQTVVQQSNVHSTLANRSPGSSPFLGHSQMETSRPTIIENTLRADVNEYAYTNRKSETIESSHSSNVSSGVPEETIHSAPCSSTEDSRPIVQSEPDQPIHSELSISSVLRHDRQVQAQDSLYGDNQDLDFSVTSKRSAGNEGLTPQWSTESLPSQGSDEVSHTLEGGSRHDFVPSPLSTVSQSPLLTDGNYDQNQFDSYSGYHDTLPPAKGDEVLVARPYPTSGREEEHPSAVAAASLENVCQQMNRLEVDANKDKLKDGGNREIIPPESNVLLPPMKELTPPLSGTFAPPVSMQAPPVAPPKSMASASGNPYAGSKNSLTHKASNKFRAGAPSPGTNEAMSYNSPLLPPVPKDSSSIPLSSDIPAPQFGFVGNVVEPPTGSDRTKTNLTSEEDVNLETPPENKERPDIVELSDQTLPDRNPLPPKNTLRANTAIMGQESHPRQWVPQAAYGASPENQEVAPRCGPDRNQYLETGQLSDDEEAEVSRYRLQDTAGWSGLHRSVPGQTTGLEAADQTESRGSAGQGFDEDVFTPPPGLHRMVPGQTEQENLAARGADGPAVPGDGLLQRMVPGRPTGDDSVGDGNTLAGDDILPPGLRRMVPGESSSPESQGVGSSQPGPASASSFQPIAAAPMETRVVTGVSRGDGQMTGGIAAPTPNCPSPGPAPDQLASKTQPTAERSETIGSDSVETYPPPSNDNASRDISSSNRRENANKDRDRRHRDDEPVGDRDARRRANHGYREWDDSPGGGRYDGDKRSHRVERHGDGEKERRDGDRRDGDRRDDDRRDRGVVDGYDRKRRDRDRNERPKSTRDRGRRDESPDARHYRDDRGKDRKHYDGRDGYGNYPSSQEDKRRYAKRNDYRDTDTGSEYNSDRDYDRREYDRRGYDRRDYDHRDKSGYRVRDDYNSRYRDSLDSRRRRDNKSRNEYSRSKFEGHDKSYRDKQDRRPKSRDQPPATHFVPPMTGFHGLNGRSLTEYLNYYSNLREYDPVGYTDWYNNVYKGLAFQQPVSYSEDRGSVHSGRSSANSGLYRERDLEHTATSYTEDHPAVTSPQRLTPSKYATAHVKATLTARGQLIKILPHYPLDGQPGIVEIHDIQGLLFSNEVRRELMNYPGPLVKGVTHKNSLIAFCNNKIKSAETNIDLFDRESVILLWKLLILLLRQNGAVLGTDIAELLLSGCQPAVVVPSRPSASSTPASHYSREDVAADEPLVASNRGAVNVKSEEELTSAFREFLLYGNTKEALEWAMKNGLWGHALFLASKMDQRTHANVIMRFANGLTMNDPLQTLYQLMSGRQPAAVTCCADEKWGDWRPHLAMILSNAAQRPELEHKSITTLGDTLGARGCLHAAHFTYLMAQVDFGTFVQKGAKIVLLGSSHHKQFDEFATNEAIQMTEIYEYARKLAGPEYSIRSLQWFKLIYAKRLAEQGLVSEAMQYAEELSTVMQQRPNHYEPSLISEIYELGDRLKYNDPLYDCSGQDGAECEELPWLVKLKQVISDIQSGTVQPEGTSYGSMSNLSFGVEAENFQSGLVSSEHAPQIAEPVSYDYNWQQHQQQVQQHNQQQQYMPTYLDPGQEQWQQQEQQPAETTEAFHQPPANQSAPQSDWSSPQPSVSQWDSQGHSAMTNDVGTSQHQQQPYSNYWDHSAHEESSAPQISLPNSAPERPQKTRSDGDSQPKSSAKAVQKKEAAKANAGNGWFGGLWNKLALRPKNQMKLPDDKNPTIVWDSDRNRWTNLDADGDEGSGDVPPPPKASTVMGNSFPSSTPALATQPAAPTHSITDQPQPNSLPPSASTPNMYKMNRGRSVRSNYVDILGGSKPTNQSLPADIFPSVGSNPASMNFFVPQPGPSAEGVEGTSPDYTNSNTVPMGSAEPNHVHQDGSAQTSEHQQPAFGGPLMFNPNNYAQPAVTYPGNANNQYRNRYPNK